MGINAVAVYDIPKHTTVILRTPTASRLRRHEILDTIATFSQHCESVRGSSLTVTQVSALWGGPPFVTYSIAASCFRVIIVWDEETSDVNVAYDVYHAITRLQNVVNSSAEALIQRESSTVTLVYEEAGHALRTDEPFILPVTISPTANRSNIFSSLGNRRQTLPPSTDPKKRISNATSNTTPKKKTLLTKLGAVLSLSSQNSKQTKPKQSEIDVQQSLKSLPPTDVFGPDGSLDNAEGPLALPQGVFEWCYFGDPLPEDAGNLNWFGHLFQPESFVAPTPSAGSFKSSFPALRTGSVSSTPLTVPSSAPPIAPALKEAAPSSITAPAPQTNGDAESTEKQQNGETIEKPNSNDSAEKALLLPAQPQIPPTPPSNEQVDPLQAPLSQPLQSTPSLESGLQPVSTSTNPLDATPVPSQETSVQNPMISFSPVQQQQQQIQNELQNKRQKLLEEQQRLQHNLQQQNVNSQTQNQQQLQQPHLLQQQQLQQQQQHQQLQQQQLQQQQLQQQQLQQQQLQQQQLQQQQQLHLQQQQNLQFPQQAPTIQSTPTNSSQTVPKTTDNEIPEALRQKPDDFDLSQLGGYKDSASIAMQETSGTIAINEPSDLKKAEDEAIRNRMNEFAISMQNGNFTSALRQVYDTLKLLCRIEPRRDREIITCSNYVLAQKILIRNTVLENEISSITIQVGNPILNQKRVECALLAMFLAELKHILPRHRVAAMRVAVEKNFQVGNFGMCARWLKQLIDKAPPNQKPLLMTQLQTCIANREQNAHMPPTNRLCYTTLQVLASPFAACNVCPAVYHASLSGMVDGQACDTCFVGTIHPKQ